MPLIEYTFDGKVNKVDKAIERIKAFEPISNGLFNTPYYVAYSGGKDSDAIRILCQLAGIPHDLVHNHTTVDAPETVRYVRSIVPAGNINYPTLSMWELIPQRSIPPTRMARYCCDVLKEDGGKDRFAMTGVRWAESASRKAKRGGVEVLASAAKNHLILNADNDESRRLFENCVKKGKRILNPIIDWTDAEVWEFLEHYGCKSNPLYAEGMKRIGCVGCPLGGAPRMQWEFERWPTYKDNYMRAFDRMLIARTAKGLPNSKWQTSQDVFDWWLNDKNQVKQVDGQMELDEWIS